MDGKDKDLQAPIRVEKCHSGSHWLPWRLLSKYDGICQDCIVGCAETDAEIMADQWAEQMKEGKDK